MDDYVVTGLLIVVEWVLVDMKEYIVSTNSYYEFQLLFGGKIDMHMD